MKKVVKLTESDLTRIVQRVINEQNDNNEAFNKFGEGYIKALVGKDTSKSAYMMALKQFQQDYTNTVRHLTMKMPKA
jgi:hypothetical protein